MIRNISSHLTPMCQFHEKKMPIWLILAIFWQIICPKNIKSYPKIMKIHHFQLPGDINCDGDASERNQP